MREREHHHVDDDDAVHQGNLAGKFRILSAPELQAVGTRIEEGNDLTQELHQLLPSLSAWDPKARQG